MIIKLSDLKLGEFIELSCGNYDVLKEKGVTDVASTARNLLSEYSFIADNLHAKAVISENSSAVCIRSRILVLNICKNLASAGFRDEAAGILSEIGESAGDNVDDSIENLLKYAKFEYERLSAGKDDRTKMSADEVRDSFYSEIAFVMSYYKMNINEKEINAHVYANLVKQIGIEIRSSKARK